MVFEAFVILPSGSALSFQYPVYLNNMTGSIFNDSFNLSKLQKRVSGTSAGSIGIDFYENGMKRICCALQVRSDLKSDCLDIDCFTREYLSNGTLHPQGYTSYKEAKFHNLENNLVANGITIGFRNLGSEITQDLTSSQIGSLFNNFISQS